MISKKIAKWVGIILLAIAILLVGLHFFISWRARSIFAYTVQQLSDNTYRAQTQKVRFHYFPLGLTAQKLTVLPVDSSGEKVFYKIKADSFKIEVGSIWSVITRKNFRMNNLSLGGLKLEITNPDLSKNRKKLNVPMAKVQEVFLQILTNFKIDHAQIKEGAISYIQHGLQPFQINHVFLDIFNLEEKKGQKNKAQPSFSAGIRLYLDKPDISLPDTAVKLLLKDLLLDTRENVFKVNQFRLLAQNEVGRPDSIALSSIRLINFNWLRWLSDGSVELDSLAASTGEVFFDYSDRELLSRKKNNRGSLNKGIRFPFLVHEVDINQIKYGLRTQSPRGLLTLQLSGDSLGITDFSFNSANENPVKVGRLDINVTNFSNNFDTSGNNSTFRKLAINNDNMMLQDFYLNLNDGRVGSGNKLVIPTLKVENFSLDALFQYRLVANKLILEQPSLVIDIKKTGRKEELDTQVKRIMANLRSSLQINELSIKQAAIDIVPQGSPSGNVRIDNLSTNINGNELLASNSIMEMVSSATALSTSGFQIQGPNIQLEVFRSTLNKKRNGIFLERLKGQIGNRLKLNLHGVELVDEKGRFDVTRLSRIELDLVKITSGTMIIDLTEAQKRKSGDATPEIKINSFETGNLAIDVQTKNGKLQVQNAAIKAENLGFMNGDAAWSKLDLQTGITNWKHEGLSLNAGSVSVRQPGITQLQHLEIITGKQFGLKQLQIPHVEIRHRIINTTDPLKGVEKIKLTEPKIVMQGGISKGPNSTIKFPDFELALLEIIDPEFKWLDEDIEKDALFQTKKGNLLLSKILLQSKTNDLRIDAANLSLTEPLLQLDSMHLAPKEMKANVSNIRFGGKAPAALDVKQNEKGVGLSMKIDSASVSNFNWVRNATSGFAAEEANFSIRDFEVKAGVQLNAASIAAHPNWVLNARSLHRLKDDYEVSLYNPVVNKLLNQISLDSMAILPQLNRAEYWSRFSAEKDFMTYRMGKTLINGWQVDRDGEETKIRIEEATVQQPNFLIERDKSAGPDTISYRPLLARSFKQIPVLFSINKLNIVDGYVRNNLIPARSQMEAHILFTQMNGSLYNLKNFDISKGDSLRFNMEANLMGEGHLKANFSQSYTDSLQTFLMEGHMGPMNINALNPLLQPLLGIRIDKGKIDSMSLNVMANNKDAFGNMRLTYNGLRMSVIRPGVKRNIINQLFSWLANIIVHAKSRGKNKSLYQERLVEKSTFNYWGKIAIKGLLTNLGIKTDKKQVRQIEKSQEERGLAVPQNKR